jgi:hypothetical protein
MPAAAPTSMRQSPATYCATSKQVVNDANAVKTTVKPNRRILRDLPAQALPSGPQQQSYSWASRGLS